MPDLASSLRIQASDPIGRLEGCVVNVKHFSLVLGKCSSMTEVSTGENCSTSATCEVYLEPCAGRWLVVRRASPNGCGPRRRNLVDFVDLLLT